MNQIINGNAPVDAMNSGESADSYDDYDAEGFMSPSDFMRMVDNAMCEEEEEDSPSEENTEYIYDEFGPALAYQVEDKDEEADEEEEEAPTRPDITTITLPELLHQIDEEEEYEDEFAYLDNMDDEEEEDDEDYAGKEFSIDPDDVISDDEDEEVEEDEEETVECQGITFERHEVLGREIFTVSDGIRTVDIDLSTLSKDAVKEALLPDGEDNYDTIKMVVDAFLDEIINLCYPFAAFSATSLFNQVKDIQECSDNFKFTTYKDTTAILAYYISDKSKDVLVDTLVKYKDTVAGNLLFALRGHMLSDGFNFGNIDAEDFIKYANHPAQRYAQNIFIQTLKSDTRTVICDGNDATDFTDTGVVPVLFGLTNEYLTDIINTAVGIATEEAEEESEVLHEAEFATEGSVLEETTEETVEVSVEVTTESTGEESLFDGVEEAEEEEISFDAGKSTEKSDEDFVVKRRF